jgi:hypothetical protein
MALTVAAATTIQLAPPYDVGDLAARSTASRFVCIQNENVQRKQQDAGPLRCVLGFSFIVTFTLRAHVNW